MRRLRTVTVPRDRGLFARAPGRSLEHRGQPDARPAGGLNANAFKETSGDRHFSGYAL